MSDNHKYYYLKLKDNFFEDESIVVLESMTDGYIYSNILLKMYLKSLKGEGKLMFNNRIPYNSQMLAQVLRHSVGDIERAIGIFKELELIEILDNGAIYINDIQNFVGKSSTEADRIRAYRAKIEQEKGQKKIELSDSYICTPEKEIEIEIELEIDKEIKKETEKKKPLPDKSDDIPYKKIIDYLNQKANKNYKATSKATKSCINGRWSEGFRYDDFVKVIDNKVADWMGNEKMEQYLRPQTLFSPKFEGYLNEAPKNERNLRSELGSEIHETLGF